MCFRFSAECNTFVVSLDQTHFCHCIFQAERKKWNEKCELKVEELLLLSTVIGKFYCPSQLRTREGCLRPENSFNCELNDLFWDNSFESDSMGERRRRTWNAKRGICGQSLLILRDLVLVFMRLVCSFFSIKREHKSFIFKKECAAERDYCCLIKNK